MDFNIFNFYFDIPVVMQISSSQQYSINSNVLWNIPGVVIVQLNIV